MQSSCEYGHHAVEKPFITGCCEINPSFTHLFAYELLADHVSFSIGACVTATATHQRTFIGGRFLTGLGAGMNKFQWSNLFKLTCGLLGCAGASAKSYLVEIVPPQSRGFWLGVLNSL